MLPEVASAILDRLLRDRPPLRLAVLFGSAARKNSLRAESDLDIGILPVDADLALDEEVRLQRGLELASGREVDLVRLDHAASFLLGEIVRDGRCLIEAPVGEWNRFRAWAMGQWLEFAPAFDHAAHRFRTRLVELSRPGTTRPDLLTQKLGLLRDQVLRLKKRRRSTLEQFGLSRDLQDATGMSFVVATQEAIDIALHIVSEDALGVPGSYGESFQLLARNSIIAVPLAERLGDLVRVRNRVVHGYASVDFARFWRELPAGISTLEEFAATLASWLERSPGA